MKIAFYWIFLFILSLSLSYGEEIEIRILHVNDFHGYAEPYKPLGSEELLGGIVYLAAKVEELRKERPSLLLSAGDMIQGNNWANLFQGESVTELMNRMRFDVMVLGNHEFDFGQDALKKRISGAKFPILGANVEGLGGIKPYTIKKGEVKVKNIYSALPFDIYIIAIKLTGKQIREVLEHGISTVEEEEGRFPQVSGLTFKYAQWLERSSRIKEIFIAWKPIDPNKEYIVATNDFLAAGGDGYKIFGEAVKTAQDFTVIGDLMKSEKVVYNDAGRWLRDAVVEYMKGMKKIASTVEGRIIELHQ